MSDDRDAEVFEARTCGKSAREVAKEFGLTIPEVERIVKAKVEEVHSGEAARQAIAFAAHRLEKAEIKFHLRAMEDDGDAASEMVSIKANERRMTMLGANAPLGHLVQISTAAAPPELTSTQYYSQVLDRLMGAPEELAGEELAAEGGDTKPN